MFNLLRARWRHGYQTVRKIREVRVHERFRGFPVIEDSVENAAAAASVCPSKAFSAFPVSIDLGRCMFCGGCARVSKGISFSSFHKTAAVNRDALVIYTGAKPESMTVTPTESVRKIRSLFGRSLKLRSVSAGGCGACELELNACSNVNFDMGRFGIDIVASPRHADGIIITGPVSANMGSALLDTYHAIPDPKIVIAAGTCAISGGIFAASPDIDRSFFDTVIPDLYLPGCPPHPLTIVNGILDLLGRR